LCRRGARAPGPPGPQRQPACNRSARRNGDPVTTDEALIKLTESTAEAVAGVLEVFCPGAVGRGAPTIVRKGADPLDGIPTPAVAADVSYVDGVTGGNVFVFSTGAARRLALAMM